MKQTRLILLTLLTVTTASQAANQAATSWGGYVPPPDSIDEHLWTNWNARNQPGKTARMLSWAGHVRGALATNALWDTNWYFFGTENFTAQTLVRTNAGEAWHLKRSAIITPLLILQSGHNFCGERADGGCGTNQWYLAVDRTNGQHWRKVVWGISRSGPAGDYYVAAVDRPWPAHLGTLPIAFYSGQGTNSFTNKLNARLYDGHFYPVFFNSQYLRTEGAHQNFIHQMPDTWSKQHQNKTPDQRSFAGGTNIPLVVNQTTRATNGLGFAIGGDSGSPTFVVISNKLVLLTGSWLTAPSIVDLKQFLADVHACTAKAGYSTSQFPVHFELLAAFPSKHRCFDGATQSPLRFLQPEL